MTTFFKWKLTLIFLLLDKAHHLSIREAYLLS